jgi:hypothetical protein
MLTRRTFVSTPDLFLGLAALVLPALLPLACSSGATSDLDTSGIGTTRSDIIGGTLDAADKSVLEILYAASYPLSACNGDSTCLQGCLDATTGMPCTSGATCSCGSSATCTGSLIGPHTVVTAGHCTDFSAGGELTGAGRPALTLCSSASDVMAITAGQPTKSGCNLAIFVLFNNACTTNDAADSCETGLIGAGNYVIADSVTNPGYDGAVVPPYTSTNNDDDIGLIHLQSSTLHNGRAEPGILTFNRTGLGASCSDLGNLRFVGYGVTDPTQGASAIAGVKYAVSRDARVKDSWHNEEDGMQTSPLSTCGPGSGQEPTCSGDSGGPSFNSGGVIVGVTSLGDPACIAYGQDTRIDAYASWIDGKMAGWGDPKNGTSAALDAGADGNQCAADCGVMTGPDASRMSATDSAVSTAEGGEGGTAQDAGNPRSMTGTDDAGGPPSSGDSGGSGGTGGHSGCSGCTVGATGPDGTGRATVLLSSTFAVSFLARRGRAWRRRRLAALPCAK